MCSNASITEILGIIDNNLVILGNKILAVKTYVTLWEILRYYFVRTFKMKTNLSCAIISLHMFFTLFSTSKYFSTIEYFPSSLWLRSTFPFFHDEYGLVLFIFIPKYSELIEILFFYWFFLRHLRIHIHYLLV